MVKLIVTDLDGTLLDGEHQVSEENIAALERAQQCGIKVAVATGRSFVSSKKIISQLPIEKFVVNVNGGKIYDVVNDEVFFEKNLSHDYVKRIMEVLNREKMPYFINHEYGFIASEDNATTQYYCRHTDAEIIISNDFKTVEELDLKVFKFLVLTEPTNYETFNEEHFKDLDIYITSSHKNNIELMPQGVDKSTAIEQILQEYGLIWENVMAFGDNFNDLEMITKSKYGFAMGNAVDKLKKYAYGITTSNDDSGVAKAVNEYLNKHF